MVAFQGGHPPFKGNSPHLRPQPSRAESSPTRSKVLPLRHGGWVPRVMQAGPGQKKPNRRARCAQLPSGYEHFLHFRPDQRVKGRTTMQATYNHVKWVHPFDSNASSMGPRPTRHVTGAPVATCKILHHHSRHYRASSTAEPAPRLEATLRMTQQCQPGTSVTGQSAAGEGATVDTARNGPAVMAVAGGRKQRSSRQPSSRPLLGQRENPLPRHEDGAPVFRPSNGSRTRNGCPTNHSSRRINSAAGQAAPLAGEAGDASPPPK
jgi:hypothetical protein